MSQQYYAHFQYLSKGEARNLNTLTISSQKTVVMSNDSSIQIYEYAPQGLTLNRTVKLHCTIKKLLVLPNKHHNSDYLFILDTKGRYAFWQPDGGFQLVQNQINNQQLHLDIYKQSSYAINKSQFCSETHHFEVLDTRGTIFFNVGQEITLIDYSIKSTGLKVQKAKRIKLQVIKYCFAGWIQNAKHERWLGLIEEIEEKTILKVHNLDKLMRVCRENEIFRLEKTNLLQFCCPANGKLLILTLNEITLLQVPSLQVISSYIVKDRLGKLLTISHELYGYVGEQLILFSGSKLKSFGSLSLNGQNILAGKGIAQVKFHRDLQDGGKLISIVTMTNQILLVILYENLWKLCHRVECLNPIYSLHQMNNQTFVAVMSKDADNYQVAIVERETILPFSKQQKYDLPIQRMIAINNGNGLLVSSKVGILLLKYNQQSLMFQSTLLSIPNQELIIANDFFCVTNKSIYKINIANETKEILHTSQIIIADTQNNNILFANEELDVKYLKCESNKIQHIRAAGQTEYAWHLVNQTLLVFQSDDIQHFYLFRGSQFITKIKMQHAAVVSSITHQKFKQSTILVIGFVDGLITLVNFQNFETIANFQNYANQPIYLQKVQDSIIASSKTKQFLLKLHVNPTLQQISLFSKDSSLQSLTYLQTQKQLIFAQKSSQQTHSIIKTVSVGHLLENNNFFIKNSYSFKKKILTSFTKQIPVVYVQKNLIYVAVAKEIYIYNAINFHCDQLIHNFYADVIGIERIEYGILVYGIDELSRNILTLLQPNTHQQLSTITLILKDNRYIKSIKSLSASSNRLICRAERFTTIYEISDTYELTELNQFTTDFNGYFLDIDPVHQIFAITDSYRFAAFYSYHDAIVPISRFISQVQINELALMDRAVVMADRAGKISILEFNVQNENAPLRMLMTEVASFNVGAEVINLTKISQHQVMYTSVGGKIGVIKLIEGQVFDCLKEIQGQMLQECQQRCGFEYKKWKNREPRDKLVDCDLVIEFLQESSKRGLKMRNNQIEKLLKLL